MNEKLFLRDPEQSDVGRRIIRQGILLIDEIGFEELTFRKLADRMGTKEASIYRYFENKHRLLLYLIDWYWQWLDFQVLYETNNLMDAREKLERVLRVLLQMNAAPPSTSDDIDLVALHNIIICEASKTYLTRHVTEDNRQQFFKPYKDLTARIAQLILAYRPGYPYTRSLASSVIETAHYQSFFMRYLPSLTDFSGNDNPASLLEFLRHLLFATLEQ